MSRSQCHFALYPKDLEGMSPRWFLSPARCFVTSGDARFTRMRIARILSSRLATSDLFDAPRDCQATVGLLSLHIPT